MTTPQKHQKLYDWLIDQPAGCENHRAAASPTQSKCAVEALKDLTSMIMCSSNQDISAFIENARAGIREKAAAENGVMADQEPDIICTD